MQTKLTIWDWLWTITSLLGLFVLLPLCFIGFSAYKEYRLKGEINAIVPNVIFDAENSIGKARNLMAEQVISYNGHDIYTANETRVAISKACAEIMTSITRQNVNLAGNSDFCDFYIHRPEGWIRADYNTVIATEYPYDLKDLSDLLSSRDRWRLYPNGENWRVKYILQSDPTIILDFEVRQKDPHFNDVGYQ